MIIQQRARDTLDRAYVAALGTGVGFTGNFDPINSLASALGIKGFEKSTVKGPLRDMLYEARKLKGLKVTPSAPTGKERGRRSLPPGMARKLRGS